MTSSVIIDRDIPSLFRATAARYAEQVAIRFAVKEVTFATVDEVSDRVAAALHVRGIVKGDRIALYCPNSDAFAIIYLGIVKAGAIVVPLNLLLKPNEIEYILNDASTVGLIYHEAFAPAVTAFRHYVPSLNVVVHVGAQKSVESDLSFTEFTAVTAQPPRPSFNSAEDVVSILYTSGTTGQPKGAMLTHRNLANNVQSVVEAMQFKPGEETMLLVLPMFHAFAATAGMLTSLLHGLTLAPLPKFEPVLVAETIAQTKATIFLGVPSMFNALLRLSDEQVAKFATIKYCVSGGAAMPVELMKRFEQRFNTMIYEGDGPTECSPVTCVNPINGVRKYASVGLPVPRVAMSIRDEVGNLLPNNVVGEICVSGPSVMKGYWQQPDETSASFFGDWFRTGDLGTRDDDGYFYIVDRIKDMVIVNGMNVYPRKVEDVLYQDPRVLEAAVIGEPHDVHGEIPVAFVVLQPEASATASEIRKMLAKSLGTHEVPRKIFFIAALPRNAAGKVLKRELRKHGELERGVDGRAQSA